jgi:hypothetical protein
VNIKEMSAPGGSPFEDIEEDDTLARILDRTEDVSALIQEAKVRVLAAYPARETYIRSTACAGGVPVPRALVSTDHSYPVCTYKGMVVLRPGQASRRRCLRGVRCRGTSLTTHCLCPPCDGGVTPCVSWVEPVGPGRVHAVVGRA